MTTEDNIVLFIRNNCRLCSKNDELIVPCICEGVKKYVHKKCLLNYINSTKIEKCELCNYSYILSYKSYVCCNLFFNILYNIFLWILVSCIGFIVFLAVTKNTEKFFDSDITGIKFLGFVFTHLSIKYRILDVSFL